mmetsp:Transcript_2867/g.4302  ORF Transcript_2867/g.4302 Transcript_2867/m.4302 type:complete len:279 (+) Transcript_2867:98-934(+)
MKLSCNNTIFVLLPVLVTSAHLRSKELSKVDFPGESGIEVNYDVSGEDLNVNEDAFLGGDNPQDEFWNKIEGEFQNNAEDTGYVGYDEKVEDIPADISSQEHISDYSFLQGVGTGFEGTMHSVLVNSSVIGDAGTETSEEIIELGSERHLCACSISNPKCCFTHPGGIGQHQILGEFRVSVRNKCHKTIWVGIHYLWGARMTTGSPMWSTNGWWKLNPGEKKYIADTRNRYVYFTGQGSGLSWGSSEYQWNVRGVKHNFFEAKLPNSFTHFTMSFTCH